MLCRHRLPELNLLFKQSLNQKKNTLQTRIARAFLCASFTRKELREMRSPSGNFCVSNDTFARGKADLRRLTVGKELLRSNRSVARFNRRSVDHAISYILGPHNVSYTSWGKKSVLIDGVRHELPLAMRKISRTHMFSNYIRDSSNGNEIKRATFFRLASTLTHVDTQLRRAVDYVSGFLVNDNFATITRLADSFIQEPELKKEFHVELEIARRYMKYGFNALAQNCDCIAHNILYGLSSNSGERTYEKASCVGCKHLFYIIQQLRNAIQNSRNEDVEIQKSAIRALEGCNTKMLLFLGHRLRVMNQQVAIKNMFLGMEHRCEQNKTSDECVIVVDYKMKFEPCYYREKTVDHYGKRGISWHGAMVSYYAMEEVNGVQVPVLHKFYMDHIIENENKQDVTAVFAVLEP